MEALVAEHSYLISYYSHLNRDTLHMIICNMIHYQNYLYTEQIQHNLRHYRFAILGDYSEQEDAAKMHMRILLFHLMRKTTFTQYSQCACEDIKKIITNACTCITVPKYTTLTNQNGLNLFEIAKLLNKNIDIHHNTIKVNDCSIDNILQLMFHYEELSTSYAAFRFSIVGKDGCSHSNFFFYDSLLNIWYRVEPGGLTFYVGNVIAEKQYMGIDNAIKAVKTNYLSNNDYHYLPSLHFINPGPYCAYYTAMILNEYVANGKHDMYYTIEVVSNPGYIRSKLQEYEAVLS